MGKVTAGSPRERRLKPPAPGIWADGMAGGTRVYPQRQIKAYTYIHHARRRMDGSDPTAGTRGTDETGRGDPNATSYGNVVARVHSGPSSVSYAVLRDLRTG